MTYEEIKRAAQSAKKRELEDEGRHSLTLNDLGRLRRLRAAGKFARKATSEKLTAIYGGAGQGRSLGSVESRSVVKRLASDAAKERNADRENVAKRALNRLQKLS